MAVPYSFQTAVGSIPLSQLDANFSTSITLGNTAVVLGNTYSTIGNLTLSNVTISSGNVTIVTSNVTTVNTVNLTVTANAAVAGNVAITGNVSVNVANVTTLNTVTSTVTGNQTVLGNVTIGGNIAVTGNVLNLNVTANASIGGNTVITGNVSVGTSSANYPMTISGTTNLIGTGSNVSATFLNTSTGQNPTTPNYTPLFVLPTQINNATSGTNNTGGIISQPNIIGSSTGTIQCLGVQGFPIAYRTALGQSAVTGGQFQGYLYNPADVTTSGSLIGVTGQAGIAVTANSTVVASSIYGGNLLTNQNLATTTNNFAVNAAPAIGSVANTSVITANASIMASVFTVPVIGTGANISANVTTFYGVFSAGPTVGATSGSGVTTVGTLYNMYLGSPTVQTTGSIGTRWGLYQTDSAATNYFAGKVGIGNTAPLTQFTVDNTQNASTVARVYNGNSGSLANAFFQAQSNDGNLYMAASSTGGGGGGVIYYDGTSQLLIKTYGAYPLTFGTSNTERGRFDSSGNFMVGTLTAGATLTVAGAASFQAPKTVNASTYTMLAADSSLIITTTSCTITLLAASSYTGRILYVKNVTANSLTSASSNVVPLGSTTAGTAILAATAGKFAMLQSDGTNWITMMAN